MSILDDHIAEATKEIQAGKVVNGIGDIDIPRAINRISFGIGVASDIYSTYDILKKTMNGGASTTEKENYIMNGTFAIIGLSSYLQAPSVASGVVFQGAGYIGLGYAALQLGAAWGEYLNGITVTGIIDDQVKNTLSSLEDVDELTRVILEGARNGKTTEELHMPNVVISVKNIAVSSGLNSIELLETPSAIISHIATGNVAHAENAKSLIVDILELIASDEYSYEVFQDIYQAGRLAYLSDNALTALDQNDISGSIANKNPWTLFLPAILAGRGNSPVLVDLNNFITFEQVKNGGNHYLVNDSLIVEVAGGSDGYMGNADKYSIKLKDEIDLKDKIIEFNINEITREQQNGYKENIGFSFLLSDGFSKIIGVTLSGKYSGYHPDYEGWDYYDQYYGHRLYLLGNENHTWSRIEHVTLDAENYYNFDFRIINSNNKYTICYKNHSQSAYGCVESNIELITSSPTIVFQAGSADGGFTRNNGNGKFQIDYFRIKDTI